MDQTESNGRLYDHVKAAFANIERDRAAALAKAQGEINERFDRQTELWLSGTMNRYGRRVDPGLKSLTWTRNEFPIPPAQSMAALSGQVSAEYTGDEEGIRIAEAWARAFGLTLNERPTEGYVEWLGEIGGADVCVWAVQPGGAS
jgi:hypothetical protein